jgi:hypothetical protein
MVFTWTKTQFALYQNTVSSILWRYIANMPLTMAGIGSADSKEYADLGTWGGEKMVFAWTKTHFSAGFWHLRGSQIAYGNVDYRHLWQT